MNFSATTCYRVSARHAEAPAADWREQLATRLGSRPRRLGVWAELGLYGALQCLGNDARLASHDALLVSSRFGPASLMLDAVAQVQEGLPLPLTFMQIQPNQILSTLSAQLGWQGDARFVAHPQPLVVLATALAMARSGGHGVLVGWVDTTPVGTSVWVHLQPETDLMSLSGKTWSRVPDGDVVALTQTITHARLDDSGPTVIIEG